MSDVYQGFDTRLRNISRKRARLADGYVSKVTKDGLIVFRPKHRKTTFPVRGLVLLMVGFFLFKAMIMAHLGGLLYEERVAALNEGTLVEQAGAYVMQADPVTQTIASKLRPFLR